MPRRAHERIPAACRRRREPRPDRQVARAVVASSDELRLNAIAKQAGVGQGTLYRHFPTREDLLAEHDPVTALARWFDRVADYARVKRGVFVAVEVGVWQDLSAHSLGPIGDAMTALLHAGRTAGTIRTDVDARDVILLIGYLTRLDEEEWDTRARHLLRVVLDGLRSGT